MIVPPKMKPVAMPAFEYMRLSVSVRGCDATGPDADKFADIHSFDAMLAALGATGGSSSLSRPPSRGAHTYMFKRQIV